jgi:ubiquinone/menaquinone biosynthesis C-methylase UbiE
MKGLSLIVPKAKTRLFDEWPDRYDRWFTTPIGALVRKYEAELLLDLLGPRPGDVILDAGCGTGVFTLDILTSGAHVIGLDSSLPMLRRALEKAGGYPFRIVLGDILDLPFPEGCFDRVASVTALEFIEDGRGAIGELFRVTKRGGYIVAATLNRLSPWASRRAAEGRKKKTIFTEAIFRSPEELRSLASAEGVIRTAIHFQKEDDPNAAPEIERSGREKGLETGAFLAARWKKDIVKSFMKKRDNI